MVNAYFYLRFPTSQCGMTILKSLPESQYFQYKWWKGGGCATFRNHDLKRRNSTKKLVTAVGFGMEVAFMMFIKEL